VAKLRARYLDALLFTPRNETARAQKCANATSDYQWQFANTRELTGESAEGARIGPVCPNPALP
jgi:hypothetical protein